MKPHLLQGVFLTPMAEKSTVYIDRPLKLSTLDCSFTKQCVSGNWGGLLLLYIYRNDKANRTNRQWGICYLFYVNSLFYIYFMFAAFSVYAMFFLYSPRFCSDADWQLKHVYFKLLDRNSCKLDVILNKV